MVRSAQLACSVLLGLTLAATGCSDNGGARPPTSAGVPAGSAIAPTFERTTATPAAADAAQQKAKAPAESAAEKDKTEPETQPDAEAPGDSAPLPDVAVTNIGMHIGGEKNTAKQKAPIRDAVKKHYDALKRCYAEGEQPKEAIFGVDMRIKKEGGLAKISNPRSGFKSKAVKQCLVAAFEKVEFEANPRNLAQMVSFSVRFNKK
jgi:hypothetical protein